MFEVTSARDGGDRGVCKRLTTRGLASDEARTALAREADILEQIAARVAAHGSVPPVPDVLARGEDAYGPFLVTRFVDGKTLRDADELDDAARAVALAVRAFAALDVVHRVGGVIHGDVHLDNVMVRSERDGAVVLLDFGLAALGPLAAPSSAFRGTALYVAPEVARGEAHDASADRFALAAALLHRASGLAPRHGVTQAALLYEAGTAPMDAWLAEVARTEHAALAELLIPLVRFDPAARAPLLPPPPG